MFQNMLLNMFCEFFLIFAKQFTVDYCYCFKDKKRSKLLFSKVAPVLRIPVGLFS